MAAAESDQHDFLPQQPHAEGVLPVTESAKGLQDGQGESSQRLKKIRSFGDLARRITDITSRVLITFLILAAGLSFGVQVLRWWRDAPFETPPSGQEGAVPPDSRSPWTNGATPQTGDQTVISTPAGRLIMVDLYGKREPIVEKAEEICLQLADSEIPSAISTSNDPGPFGQQLSGFSPLNMSPAGLQLFRAPGNVPLYAIVRARPGEGQPASEPGSDPSENWETTESAGVQSPQVATGHAVPEGVVAWALLLPSGVDRWTLCFATASNSAPQNQQVTAIKTPGTTQPDPPLELPPGAQWVFQLSPRSDQWWGVMRETEPGSSANWHESLGRSLARAGWRQESDWLRSGRFKRATFQRSQAQAFLEFLLITIETGGNQPGKATVLWLRQDAPAP